MHNKKVNALMGFIFIFFRFKGKKYVPYINGLFQIGHILEPNSDYFETKSS